MFKKLTSVIILLLSSILTLAGCQSSGPVPKQAHIAIICTSAVKPQSELIFLDKEGRQLDSLPLKAQGIFKMEQPDPSTLVLPVMYSDQIITLDLQKNTLQTRKTRKHPLFYHKMDEREFIIFNSDENDDIDYLTYTLKDNLGEQNMRIKGFPLAMTTARDRAFVYLKQQDAADSILIFDLANFTVQQIPLNAYHFEGVRDLCVFGDQLFFPVAVSHELVKIPLNGLGAITSTTLPSPAPLLLMEYQQQLLVAHYMGEITLLDSVTLETIQSIRVPYTILTARLDQDQLYLLVKEENTDRTIVVVNLVKAQIERVIKIQHDAELLLQNFVVF